MGEIRTCGKCGRSRDTSNSSDWTCPHCGYTQWGIIAIYGVFSLLSLGAAIFWGPMIKGSSLRFIVKWGGGIVGAIVLLAVIYWVISALKTAKEKRLLSTGNYVTYPAATGTPSAAKTSTTLGDAAFYHEVPPQNALAEEQVEHTYPNGNVYIGGWKDGKMEGWGTLSDPYGYFQYVGNWKEGKLNGQGSLTTTGMKYWGDWKDGRYNGQGNLNDILGKFSYSGSFKDGEMDGQGTMIYADGTVKSGVWENGRLIR